MKKLAVNPLSILLSIIAGAALGYIGGPAVALVSWALVGFLIGVGSKCLKAAIANGAAYGFALAYVFMVADYDGAEPLSSKLLPFVVFGIVGAVCGVALAWIGLVVTKHQPVK